MRSLARKADDRHVRSAKNVVEFVAGDLSTALPVQSCGISGGKFRILTHGGRNLEGPEIEKFLNPISLPKRGMRGTRPRILDERELG